MDLCCVVESNLQAFVLLFYFVYNDDSMPTNPFSILILLSPNCVIC